MALSDHFNKEDKEHRALVTAITRLHVGAAEIFLLRIKPPAGFTYKPGQYVDVGFGNLSPRSYSIANAPGEDTIEIHIKRASGEASLFVASLLRVGDQVKLSQAQGDSFFNPGEKKPLLVIAGGMGFTPAKAVVEAALRHDPDADVRFFWGTNHPDELYMRAYFENLAAQYDRFFFHPVSGAPVGDAVISHYRNLSGYRIYVAGPPPMVSAVLPQLLSCGADRAAITYDRQAPRHQAGPQQP